MFECDGLVGHFSPSFNFFPQQIENKIDGTTTQMSHVIIASTVFKLKSSQATTININSRQDTLQHLGKQNLKPDAVLLVSNSHC